jgi:phage-related tail fiber protein
MADFRGTILTTRGRNLLAKAQTGATLTFTKIKLGDGFWSSDTDPNLLDDLVSPKMDLPIEDLRIVGDGTVRLRFVLTNTGLSQGFFMQEIGIYAQDPDLGEILYAVAYAGERGDFIPPDGATKVENVVDIYTVIANAQNVTAVISDTVVLATRRDIDELAQSLDNLSSQVNSQLTSQIDKLTTKRQASQIDNLTQQLNDTASTLSNQISTVKPEAGSTAPSLVYPGKIWIDANDFLQYYDGSDVEKHQSILRRHRRWPTPVECNSAS